MQQERERGGDEGHRARQARREHKICDEDDRYDQERGPTDADRVLDRADVVPALVAMRHHRADQYLRHQHDGDGPRQRREVNLVEVLVPKRGRDVQRDRPCADIPSGMRASRRIFHANPECRRMFFDTAAVSDSRDHAAA